MKKITLEEADYAAKLLGFRYRSEAWFCGVGIEYDNNLNYFWLTLRGTDKTPQDIKDIKECEGVRVIFLTRELARILPAVDP